MVVVVITTVWWTTGFNLMLFLAGLHEIPDHLYEAAKLDGAGPGRTLGTSPSQG